MTTQEGFKRRFGEVYQYQDIFGDQSVDLIAEIRKIEQAGHFLAEQLGMSDVMEGAFRMFHPGTPKRTDCQHMVLIERYESLVIWATAETAAQTSSLWMQAILANQDNESTWLGDAYQMLDDSVTLAKPIESNSTAIDWMTFNPTKKSALVDFPLLVDELAHLTSEAGFNETAVRCFGMTTAAGPALNYAHILLEHADAATMNEVLTWREESPALSDWRQRLDQIKGELVSQQTLTEAS